MRFSGLFVPKTVQEAIEAFERANGAAFYVNGGTDVLVVAREKDRFDGKLAIDLSGLAELEGAARGDGHAPDRCGLHTRADRGRPAGSAVCVGAGGGVLRGRLAADPQSRHARRKHSKRLSGGRHAGSLALHQARLLLRSPQGARECALGGL